MARIFSPCAIAKIQVAINSPACAPTMVAPRILPFLVGDDLDMAVGFALGLGAIVVVVGPAQNADFHVALARLRFGDAGLRQLRLGIGHPWNDVVVHAHRQAEQRVPDHQAGVIIGGVGELQLSGRTVADGVDAPVAGLELRVHRDAGAVIANAGRIQIEPLDRRLAPGGDQQMTAFDCLLVAVAAQWSPSRCPRK